MIFIVTKSDFDIEDEIRRMREKILVLEDHKEFLAEVLDTLQEFYTVLGTSTPPEALEAAQKNSFDLFITDVRMAGPMDGIGALAHIKQACPSIYSIVMTGFSNTDSEVRAMEYGVDFYIHKPFRSEQYFLDAVAQVLATRTIQTTIQHQIKNVFASAFRQLIGNKNAVPPALEIERNLLFKAYYTGIQCDKMSTYGAIMIWDQLVLLEKRYEELEEILGPSADQLAQDYRILLTECQQYTKTFQSELIPKREPSVITKSLFQRLYDRIQSGKVGLQLLFRAPSLWNLSREPSVAGRANLNVLWNQLFAEDEIAKNAKDRFAQFMQKLGDNPKEPDSMISNPGSGLRAP